MVKGFSLLEVCISLMLLNIAFILMYKVITRADINRHVAFYRILAKEQLKDGESLLRLNVPTEAALQPWQRLVKQVLPKGKATISHEPLQVCWVLLAKQHCIDENITE